MRTRTVVVQAHTHQFLGTFGGPGNGDYRGELVRAIQLISSYATKVALPLAQVLLRLDGLYGDAAPLIDVLGAGLGVIARSRDYRLLGLEEVKQALARPGRILCPVTFLASISSPHSGTIDLGPFTIHQPRSMCPAYRPASM